LRESRTSQEHAARSLTNKPSGDLAPVWKCDTCGFRGLSFGFGFWGFGVLVLGCWLWVVGFGFWVLGFGVWGFGFGVLGSGFWVLGFGVWVLEFRGWATLVGTHLAVLVDDATSSFKRTDRVANIDLDYTS